MKKEGKSWGGGKGGEETFFERRRAHTRPTLCLSLSALFQMAYFFLVDGGGREREEKEWKYVEAEEGEGRKKRLH